MESLRNVFIDFLQGKLFGRGNAKKEKHVKMREIKVRSTAERLCRGLSIETYYRSLSLHLFRENCNIFEWSLEAIKWRN